MTRRRPVAARAAAGALVALIIGAPPVPAQQPAPPGAAACGGCHGTADRLAAIPTLQGRAPADLVTAMREFRNGVRRATVMDRIAKGFADDELAAIAAYVAGGGR